MTDKEKLDKLVAEIERRKKEVIDNIFELGNSESERIGLFDRKEIYDDLLSFINSIQEEPKECMYSKGNYTDEDRKVLCEGCEDKCKFNKKEEPVSEDLEEAAKHYLYSNILYDDVYVGNPTDKDCIEMFKAGAKWQKENLWKPADGDDLPEYDREVIALLENGKVVFAHRPPEFWVGKNIITGKVTKNYPKTYDKGGWNIPDVKYWLDVKLPKEIEL